MPKQSLISRSPLFLILVGISMQRRRSKLDSRLIELRSKVEGLEEEREANRIQKEGLQREISEIQSKITETEEANKTTILNLQQQISELKKELEHAKHEAKQSSMMDLEIADYDRTVQSLNVQLRQQNEKLTELQGDIVKHEERAKSLQEEITTIEEQRLQSEDRGNKLKQMLVKTKRDLADSKKWESEQRTSDAQLRGQMEHLTQQVEDYKVQLGELAAENQKLNSRLRGTDESSQRTVKVLENRIHSLQSELNITQNELETIQNEYDGYKVRVHSVLKQQKTKVPDVEANADKLERERLEHAVEQLKTKLKEKSDQIQDAEQDADRLQEEHDRLLQRHNKQLHDMQDKENTFRQRMERMSEEKSACTSEQLETIRQLTVQNEKITQSYKDQITLLQTDHHRSIDMLQQQLDMTDNENTKLRQEIQQLSKFAEQERDTSPVLESVPDIRYEIRQEGEGSEIVDPEPGHKVNSLNLEYYERLKFPLDIIYVASKLLENEYALKEKLLTSDKRLEHTTELLNESEATVMRLTEQAKILKEEIRRLERNQQREKEAANWEYLKNILIKFLTLNVGDERDSLIPVMTMMLKLSPEETEKLHMVARGGEVEGGQPKPAGWGSYLHRWSGLSS
ncbi:hypothetical protein ScPMuIL_018695 [Solemya velum]